MLIQKDFDAEEILGDAKYEIKISIEKAIEDAIEGIGESFKKQALESAFYDWEDGDSHMAIDNLVMEMLRKLNVNYEDLTTEQRMYLDGFKKHIFVKA